MSRLILREEATATQLRMPELLFQVCLRVDEQKSGRQAIAFTARTPASSGHDAV